MNSQELECTEKVVSDLMMEIARLRNENENLRIENIQIKADRDEWKDGFKLLHNMIENKNNQLTGYDETLFERSSSDQDDYNEEDLVNAYSLAEKDFKFAGVGFSFN